MSDMPKVDYAEFTRSAISRVAFAISVVLLLTKASFAEPPANTVQPTKFPVTPGLPDVSPTQILAKATTTLIRTFDDLLKDPARYDAQAIRECGLFPEGRLYPFAIPALGYANLALSGKANKTYCILQMRKLIDLMLPHVVQNVSAPNGRLEEIRSYGKHGTWLSTLNLVLTCYAMLSDDGRYNDIHTTVSQVLYDALQEANGGPIASYPTYTWNFDTIMAFASLWYDTDPNIAAGSRPLLRQHLTWREQHAKHGPTGLTESFRGEMPRGCDVSMQICLLAQMDYAYTKSMYAKYTLSHWVDLGFAAGFSEWPRGSVAPIAADVDSGPVLFGIGATATGIGVGAAIAMNDEMRLQRLVSEIPLVPMAIGMLKQVGLASPPMAWFQGLSALNDRYITGFLYGDCMMLYALTWTPYSNIPPMGEQSVPGYPPQGVGSPEP